MRWQMGDPMPEWVERVTRWNDDGELVLERKSGRQVIRHGEVIAINPDGEITHLVDIGIPEKPGVNSRFS